MPLPARLLTAAHVHAEYGLPVSTVRSFVRAGVLPVVRFRTSRRWWAQRRDLDALITGTVLGRVERSEVILIQPRTTGTAQAVLRPDVSTRETA